LNAMANVEPCAAILGMEVVRIRGKRSGPIRVTLRLAERVRAVERDPRIDAGGQARHELVLFEDTARFIEVDGGNVGSRQASVRGDRARTQAVTASRAQVVGRQDQWYWGFMLSAHGPLGHTQ